MLNFSRQQRKINIDQLLSLFSTCKDVLTPNPPPKNLEHKNCIIYICFQWEKHSIFSSKVYFCEKSFGLQCVKIIKFKKVPLNKKSSKKFKLWYIFFIFKFILIILGLVHEKRSWSCTSIVKNSWHTLAKNCWLLANSSSDSQLLFRFLSVSGLKQRGNF